jgi:hypothetical protein
VQRVTPRILTASLMCQNDCGICSICPGANVGTSCASIAKRRTVGSFARKLATTAVASNNIIVRNTACLSDAWNGVTDAAHVHARRALPISQTVITPHVRREDATIPNHTLDACDFAKTSQCLSH